MTKYKDGTLWNEDIMPIVKVLNWVNMEFGEKDFDVLKRTGNLGIVFPFKGETVELHLKLKKKK